MTVDIYYISIHYAFLFSAGSLSGLECILMKLYSTLFQHRDMIYYDMGFIHWADTQDLMECVIIFKPFYVKAS